MENKKNLRNLIVYLAIPVLLIFILFFVYKNESAEEYKYSQILDYFNKGQVTEFTLNYGTGELKLKLSDEAVADNKDNTDKKSEIKYFVANPVVFYEDVKPFITEYNSTHSSEPLKFDIERATETSWIFNIFQYLLFIGIAVSVVVMMRKMSSGLGDAGRQIGFAKAKIKNTEDEKRKTTFADVAGADEEKEELREIVEFLKQPKKFNELGARIPKGVLLVGPPGTGKTLLARAVAGEAGVPFFSISGSDFVEMFVGVGASRVRDLFDMAKKNAPCIIFIDEIDAVGRQRGAGLGGGHDEREQTLNQLLVEMDGFGANEGVIVIAATNRPDILDPALMRPGRFDRQVMVGYPDIKGREEILKIHARGKPIAPDVKLSTIAKTTAGFTGADLENLLNESALLAARKDKKAITMEEIEEATIKVVAGTEKKSRVISDKEKNLTAYHEAGHAVATYYCKTQDPVHQVSIIPRGMAGGYTMALPSEDRSYRSRTEMAEDIIVLLGGRVAEALILGDISTGASNDIERATKTALSMVTKYGMSDNLGPICYGSENDEVFIGRDMGHIKNYSEQTAAEIDKEIRLIIQNSYKLTEQILSDHTDKLHDVAKYLFIHEKMDGEVFKSIMEGTYVEPETDENGEDNTDTTAKMPDEGNGTDASADETDASTDAESTVNGSNSEINSNDIPSNGGESEQTNK